MDDKAVGKIGQALGHPTRVRLVRRLRGSEPASASRLAEEIDEALGNVSYHLRVLERLGVVREASSRHVRGALEHFFAFDGPNAKRVALILDTLDGPTGPA